MKKYPFLLLLFIANYQFTIAQISETDSLEDLVQKYQKKDTTRVNLLNQTAYKLYLKDFEKTLVYATEANELAEELNFLKGKSDSFRYIGIHYYMKANYSKALEFYQKSLKIEEELDNNLGIAKGCNNIGMIYRFQKDFPKSLKYLEMALQKSREVGDNLVISFSLNNLGNTYRSMENYSKSLEYYQKSLEIKKKLGSKLGIASSFHNIGKNYKHQNQYVKALDYLQKSLAISIEIKTKSIEARNYTELASVYLRQNKAKEALNYGKKAYHLASEIGELNFQKESLEIVSKSCDILGLYKKAYDYHVTFKALNDSIFNGNNIKEITNLENQYKYDKEKEVVALEQEKKDAIQEAEVKEQKKVRNLLILGIILTFLLVFIAIYGFIQKKKANTILAEQKEKIQASNEELNQINEELHSTVETVNQQKFEIEKTHQKTQKSINYASKIQNALLPSQKTISQFFLEHFILFKPKDIVSGDFYYLKKVNDFLIIAVADCTGHGVPGAFVSLLGISFLNEIITKKEIKTAADILESLRSQVKSSLKQNAENNQSKDGMDIALCILDTQTNLMQFAGAYNPLYIVRNKELIEIKGSKNPISVHLKEKPFKNHEIQLQKEDSIYLFSDGYIDQFGGEKGRKFMSKRFKELLIEIAEKSSKEQKEMLETSLQNWQGNEKQIDDITVLGFKIKKNHLETA